MTSLETRAVVVAYFKVQHLLGGVYPPSLQLNLITVRDDLLSWCHVAAHHTSAGRWAAEHVGPVLSAAMGASTDMRKIASAGDLLRCFGLSGGDRALSPKDAWRVVKAYTYEPVVSAYSLSQIAIAANTTLRKLPQEPSPTDVLMELTRLRSSPFLVQLSRWIADHIRHQVGGTYGNLYRRTLDDLENLNNSGEMMHSAAHSIGGGRKLEREDWDSILAGRVPAFRLQERAAFASAKQFILDYYGRCKKKDPQLGISLDSETARV